MRIVLLAMLTVVAYGQHVHSPTRAYRDESNRLICPENDCVLDRSERVGVYKGKDGFDHICIGDGCEPSFDIYQRLARIDNSLAGLDIGLVVVFVVEMLGLAMGLVMLERMVRK